MSKPEQEVPSMIDALVTYDIIEQFKDWLSPGGGWYISPETKKIEPTSRGIDWTRNWIFTNPSPTLRCNFYMDGVFTHLGFVHSTCMECWKVVVKMHYVTQLFKMYQWQKEFVKDDYGKDRFCKCGIEERPYVHYQYGAYFYNRGIEQGKLRHGQVLRGMQELFGKDNVSDKPGSWDDGKVEVILKRYCTEFELKLGPTNQYKRPDNADFIEDKLHNAFELEKLNPGQPDYLLEHVMANWLKFAWDRGDPTAKQFHGGKPFYTPVITYHDQEKTESKED